MNPYFLKKILSCSIKLLGAIKIHTSIIPWLYQNPSMRAKYRFLCIDTQNWKKVIPFACIEIYQPLQGKPYVTRVHKMNFDPVY